MKTSVIEIRDMLSVLSVAGVEKRIGKAGGVESVTVNYAAGNATVRYDETRLDIADIKSDVRQGGYEEDGAPAGGSAAHGHGAYAAPAATPDAAPKAPMKDAAGGAPAGSASLDPSSPGAEPPASAKPAPPASDAASTGPTPPAPGAAAPDSSPPSDGSKGKAAPAMS